MKPDQAVHAIIDAVSPDVQQPVGATGDSAPIPGFERPLQMLCACHGRVAEAVRRTSRLVPHVLLHGCDTAARTAAAGAIRFFDSAAKDLHADEDVDLFPALIESMAGSDPVCIREMTRALTAEHRELEAHWQSLRGQLERIARGEATLLEAVDVESLAGGYDRHIAREESELLPMASRLLTDAELERVGRAMRARRGVTGPESGDAAT